MEDIVDSIFLRLKIILVVQEPNYMHCSRQQTERFLCNDSRILLRDVKRIIDDWLSRRTSLEPVVEHSLTLEFQWTPEKDSENPDESRHEIPIKNLQVK